MNATTLSADGLGSRRSWRSVGLSVGLVGVVLLAGCSTRSVSGPAPVEDRTGGKMTDVKPLPGAENAGKPGYFTVRPGDTLYRIALESGQSPRDVQTWNNLTNPNLIEVGQVLRVAPPAGANAVAMAPVPGAAGVTAAPVATQGVVARPLNGTAATAPLPAPGAGPAPVAVAPATPVPEPVQAGEEVNFVWPAQGSVISQFDEAKNKGVAIAGRVGDPVVAAADGRVVYAGAGLRGYGNLIILKHNSTFLTAYAHNQALLVREDQAVKQGQKIAEMGSSDADRVKLHFEVRRNGKPVDPMGYLPKN
ncbi:peptidoglycan DD-metalloendopeptidase family protein [Hydrogenophaga sp. PAMC20947]|uniref:peptidoglycan DD-metalloendopeptidase family protein n=1 Tax=Hydrogenophaga sp. PAMC20947 TaxID=2565558 RepID=UPI00109DF395|nr:peptidoglycan DD-metalloendopeptidase family protein [Hydrogenophaga sp. PAMC20947]QCB48629.1 LysM peptidoglycan-binding domain-containing protein [Hydrogenophaga sp. PAMC20947]